MTVAIRGTLWYHFATGHGLRGQMTSEFTLTAAHEWIAHDPFGRPKPTDVSANAHSITNDQGAATLCAARNGYVSFRVLVQGAGEYRLSASMRGGLEVDLSRAWYHRMAADEGEPPQWWPDALVPVRGRKTYQLPDPDNAIDGQTTQEFWVDVFVPKDAKPGVVSGRVRLSTGGETVSLPVKVRVLETALPDEPCVTVDHNSYSAGMDAVPRGQLTSPRVWRRPIADLHNRHRLFHEHRGVFHNLGYKQSGAVEPIYGPRVEGRGRDLRLVDWELFDQYHGPLLDGSAFATAAPGAPAPRRAAAPIWGAYTPINPIWPADYLWWGEKGYEVEFTRGVRQFDAHLREKGWTHSRMQFFFNHKKRHRWFEWDGDEPKFLKDMGYHKEMIRMWESVTADSPVPWVYRMDASWQMKNQFAVLAGHRNMWVCGGFITWYPDEVRQVMARGEIVWWYGGTPPIHTASSGILSAIYRTWARGVQGFCAWSTVNPGKDPWFDCNGCATGLLYPGDRFGIPGPIPSIRLKIERNGIQDIDLLDRVTKEAGNADALREDWRRSIPIPVWEKPSPSAYSLPPEDWDSPTLAAEHEPVYQADETLDPSWWQHIRGRALA